MNYASGSPAPMTPEAKLADRRWRYLNSWWIFVPVLSCGFLGWLGFMVAGIRTQQRKYWVACGIYSLFTVAFFAVVSVFESDDPASNWALIPFFGCWIAPTVHAAIINRDYLRTLAAQGAWYGTPSQHGAQSTSHTHQQTGPHTQPFLGINNSDYYGPGTQSTSQPFTQAQPPSAPFQGPTQTNPHAYYRGTPAPSPQPNPPAASATPPREPEAGGPAQVDIAHATTDQLASLPGINQALANRIIAIRDARGGYRDLDDLASAANLQPHELTRLRGHLAFSDQPSQQPQTGQQGSGRILDI